MFRIFFVAFALAACEPAASTPDAGATDTHAPFTCACDEGERCGDCLAAIGRCCYGDETIQGRVGALAASCDGRPSCRACCSECAALSCRELRAHGMCLNLDDGEPTPGAP